MQTRPKSSRGGPLTYVSAASPLSFSRRLYLPASSLFLHQLSALAFSGPLSCCQLHLLKVATCPLMSQITFTQKAFATTQSLKQNPNSTKPQASTLFLSSTYLSTVPSVYRHKQTPGAHPQVPGFSWSGLGRHRAGNHSLLNPASLLTGP